MSPGIIPIKIGACFLLFALAFAGVLLPVKWAWIANSPKALACANAYAAGVFLSLALVHLMPEAHDQQSKAEARWRLTPMATAFGYFAILSIETALRSGAGAEGTAELLAVGGGDDDDDESLDGGAPAEPRAPARRGQTAAATAYILMGTLCAHSVIEGATIGMAVEKREAGLLALSISIHKAIAGTALGSNLAQEGVTRNVFALALVFALSSPAGVGLGWAFESVASSTFGPVVKALSAGTFLYIGASELVPQEFASVRSAASASPLAKLPGLGLGIVTVYLLSVLMDFD